MLNPKLSPDELFYWTLLPPPSINSAKGSSLSLFRFPVGFELKFRFIAPIFPYTLGIELLYGYELPPKLKELPKFMFELCCYLLFPAN